MKTLYRVEYTTVAYVLADSPKDAIKQGRPAITDAGPDSEDAYEVNETDRPDAPWDFHCLVYHAGREDIPLGSVWPGADWAPPPPPPPARFAWNEHEWIMDGKVVLRADLPLIPKRQWFAENSALAKVMATGDRGIASLLDLCAQSTEAANIGFEVVGDDVRLTFGNKVMRVSLAHVTADHYTRVVWNHIPVVVAWLDGEIQAISTPIREGVEFEVEVTP